jgi:hypothetical protein
MPTLTVSKWRIIVLKLINHEGGERVSDEVQVGVPVPPRRDGIQLEQEARKEQQSDNICPDSAKTCQRK